jgi:amino acid transporter
MTQAARDRTLDSGAVSDDAYLEQLGYKPELKRTLGQFSSFAIQFGTIAPIGGIVFTIGIALSQVGPAAIWPWIIAGGLQMLIAFCVAEACSSYPVAGAAYNIVSRLGGRFLGWQTGWWLEVAHIVSVSGSCVAVAPIIASWFGFVDLTSWQLVGVTGVLILISTLINVASVKVSSRFVDSGVFATLVACVLVSVVLAGALIFGNNDVHSVSYLFTTDGQVNTSLVLPLLFAALLPCIVLNGFDVSGNASEETKNAARAVPRGMVIANGASYLFGTIVIVLLLLGMTNTSDTVGATQPVTFILEPILGTPMAKTFEALAVLGLYVSAVVLQLAGARVLWAQARDGELPAAKWMGKLNKDKVPTVGVWVAGVIAFLLVLWSDLYAVLIAMTVVLWVAAYGVLITCLFVGKLRGNVPRPAFAVKGWRVLFPVAIIWSVVVAAVLIYQNPKDVGLGLLAVAVIGLSIYFIGLPKARGAAIVAASHHPMAASADQPDASPAPAGLPATGSDSPLRS